MADQELQDLTESTAPASGDLLYAVVDPAGTPLSRKVTVNNVLKAVNVLSANTTPATTDLALLMDDPGGTLAANKITLANLLKVVNSLDANATPASTDTMLIMDDPAGTLAAQKVTVANVLGLVTSQVYLSAPAGVPKTTAGCAAAAAAELATNDVNLKTCAFDASTEEHLDFTFALPSDYNGGTMTAKFYWMHAATDTNFAVMWGIEGRCYGDDEAMDQAPGTAQTVTDTGGTTSDLYVSAATSAITWAGTPAAGELIHVTVYRKAADEADTLAIDALLIGVQLTYVRT